MPASSTCSGLARRISARRGSRPYWLPCAGPDDVPSLPEIHRLVTDDQHLVLQFTLPAANEDSAAEDSTIVDTAVAPAAFDKRSIIDHLAAMLPEYSVFDGGGRAGGIELVTIKKVVARQDVLDNAERIAEAARDFRLTAQDLMVRLAHHLHIPIEEFCNGRYWSLLPDKEGRGAMDAEWRYYFHGAECCFTNIATGQTLDVILERENEFGVLDPYFFWKFVDTTPEWHDVARLLKGDYHDAARAFEVLEERGLLKRLDNTRPYQRCLVVSDIVTPNIVTSDSNVSGILVEPPFKSKHFMEHRKAIAPGRYCRLWRERNGYD